MAAKIPVLLALDETYVDDVWALLKREGVPQEQTWSAAAKVAAKTTFGLGHLAKLLAIQSNLELSVEGEGSLDTKRTLTPVLRAFMITELLDLDQAATLNAIEENEFAYVICEDVEVIPLPTLPSYLIDGGGDDKGSLADAIAMLTAASRAIVLKTAEGDANSLVSKLTARDEDVLFKTMAATEGDHQLIVGRLGAAPDVIAYAVLADRWIKHNLAGSTIGRSVGFFGQVLSTSEQIDSKDLVRLLPLYVTLA